MSLNLLLENAAKPWANMRINECTIDGQLSAGDVVLETLTVPTLVVDAPSAANHSLLTCQDVEGTCAWQNTAQLSTLTAGAIVATNAGPIPAAVSTTSLQVTHGAAAGSVLTSDADGNASWAVAPGNVHQVIMTLSPTQVNGMYATPVELVPAPPTGYTNVPINTNILYRGGSAPFAGGGAIIPQWGTAAHGAGTNSAGRTLAAAVITSDTVSVLNIIGMNISGSLAASASANLSICLSNQTAAFTVGTGAALVVSITYTIVPGI